MTIPKGTLVRVHAPINTDKGYIREHGELWVITAARDDMYYCKALATGGEYYWFEYEFEVAAKEQADATQGHVGAGAGECTA